MFVGLLRAPLRLVCVAPAFIFTALKLRAKLALETKCRTHWTLDHYYSLLTTSSPSTQQINIKENGMILEPSCLQCASYLVFCFSRMLQKVRVGRWMGLVVFFPKNRKHLLTPLCFECIFFFSDETWPMAFLSFSLLGTRTSFVVCMFLAVQVRNQRNRAQKEMKKGPFFWALGPSGRNMRDRWEGERETERNGTWGFVMIWLNSTDGANSSLW